MFKQIVSSLIIFSMLWIDVVKAMDEEDDKTPPLIRHATPPSKRTSSEPSPKEFIDTALRHPLTEKSSLLVNGTGESYQATKLAIVPSSNGYSVNGHTKELALVLTNGHKNPKKHIRLESSSSDEEDRKSTDKVDSLGEIEFKLKTKNSRCCCCWGGSSSKDVESGKEDDLYQIGSERPLLFIKEGPTLTELKKQALLSFVALVEEDSKISKKKSKRDLISLEEQPLDEEELLAQKARALAKEFEKDKSLEEFGNWFQGHVLDNRYRWQDWLGLFGSLCMAAGTGAAMSVIVEYSIYNSFFAHHLKEYMPIVGPLGRYINVSSSLTTLVDAGTFMPEATSPSTRNFTTPKSAREKTADRVLIPLAAISGVYLLLLHFQIQQKLIKDEGSKGFWTNPHDQFWLATAVPLFSYLVGQTWRGMRTAVSNWFHPVVPEHVKDQVLALRTLEARLDHLPNDAVDDLYDLLKKSLFKNKPSEWALYLSKGQMSDISKVEGQLNYIALINYAEKITLLEDVEDIPQTGGVKTRWASRILASLGLPAGFGLVAISIFGVLSSFMAPIAAITLSLTAATLGFVPEAFLQGHNVKETLDAISAKESGPKKSLEETLKDPYAWGRGAAKVIGVVWSFLQNALTNLSPIFVSLVMLIPAQLGGSDTAQTAMTGVMIGLAIPYLCSELLNGTGDMYGHAVTGMWAVVDFFYGVRDRVAKCCGNEFKITKNRKTREIRRILKKTIATSIRFTPDHVEQMNTLKLRLNPENHF